MSNPVDVGFIGLGQMGAPIAERLRHPSIRLHVHDLSEAAMAPFVDAGATAHASPRSVADAAGIVFACLPSPDISREVALGEQGVAHGKSVRIYADMSTIGPETIIGIADALGERGITVLDSPVTGGPPMARQGRLTLIVSGPAAAVEEARPILSHMGRAIHVMGERAGMAQLAKVINNIIMAANMLAAGEGLSLGVKAGLDAGRMLDLLADGTGRSFAACDILRRAVGGTFDFGAALSIVEKDTNLGRKEAERRGLELPLIFRSAQEWTAAMETLGGKVDFTEVIRLQEARLGQEIRAGKGA